MSSTRSKHILVVNQSAHPSSTLLREMLASAPGLEMHQLDLLPAGDQTGQESQQMEEHHKAKTEDEIITKLQELALDQRYTGAHHVYVVNAGPIDGIDPMQQGMLKAMLNQSMSQRSEVSAVALPAEGEDITGEAEELFLEEVATLETFLKPYGIKVYTSPWLAAQAIAG